MADDPLTRSRSSAVTNEIDANSAGKARLTFDDVPHSLEGLKKLLTQGSWKAAIKLSDILSETAKFPHDKMKFKCCKIVAQTKMRQYKAAHDELETIGSFSDPKNCFEAYPEFYNNLRGSFVPFTLLVLRAELPYFMKTNTSLDGLYKLASQCKKECEFFKSNNPKLEKVTKPMPDLQALTPLSASSFSNFGPLSNFTMDELFFGSLNETLAIWEERERKVTLLIVTRLIQESENSLAIELLEESIKSNPDPTIISALGRLQLTIGNVKGAQNSFKKVEAQFDKPDSSAIVHMNRGYAALAVEQYSAAIKHFSGVLEIDPNNLVASNNKAICYLYTCELSAAVATLEELITKAPEKNLNETVVFNVCTLYGLLADQSLEKKKKLMALAAKYASDSFDFSVLKLN